MIGLLERMLKVFDNRDLQANWEGSLTQEERSAIIYYSETMETSDDVRSGKSIHSKPFYNAIDRAPNYLGIIYRGQYLNDQNVIDSMTVVGHEFTFGYNGKSSAGSKSRSIADEFIDDFENHIAAIFKIEIKTGVDISNLVLDEYKRQEEVVIRANTRFRVIGADWKQTAYIRYWDLSVKEI